VGVGIARDYRGHGGDRGPRQEEYMKLALIGFGQAGKVVDKFLAYERRAGLDVFSSPLAVNTAKTELHGLERVPEDDRVLIGQARVNGHGVGADNELGAEIASLY